MTKRQITILIVLGISACGALGLASFFCVDTALFSIANLFSNNVSIDESSLATSQTSALSNSPTQTLIPSASLEDGVYLKSNPGAYSRIAAFDSNNIFDAISTLPITSDNTPVFIIKGSQYPVDSAKLYGYYAGIGVSVKNISLGTLKSGGEIVQVFEDSPAERAGLKPGEIILKVDGQPFKYIQHISNGVPNKNDLIEIINPNQMEVDLEILSGTTERSIILARTYRPTAEDNFKTDRYHSNLTLEPNGDHVLLKTDWPLRPGVYRLELEPLVHLCKN